MCCVLSQGSNGVTMRQAVIPHHLIHSAPHLVFRHSGCITDRGRTIEESTGRFAEWTVALLLQLSLRDAGPGAIRTIVETGFDVLEE